MKCQDSTPLTYLATQGQSRASRYQVTAAPQSSEPEITARKARAVVLSRNQSA
jgi:hypothetical protein